jgi:hypothetical protein
MRIALAFLATLLAGAALHAQEVILKDGTTYSGYISEQTTDGKACITYTSAIFTVPGDSLSLYQSDTRNEVRWKQRTFDDVDILEEGDWVTFQTFHPGSIYVAIKDIERITYAPLAHIHDVVVADRTYEGYIVENVIGKCTKMDVDGKIIVIATDKIKSQSKVTIDRDKSLNIKLFPFLDVYDIKGMPTITGALITQNFVDAQVIFLTKDGSLMPLSMDKITNTRRIPNDSFDDSLPVAVDTVDYRINTLVPKWIDVMIDKKEVVSLPVDSLIKNTLSIQDSMLMVDAKENLEELVLVPFNPFNFKSGVINLGKMEDLVAKTPRPSSTATSLGRRETCYEKLEVGFYLLLDKKGKRVAPVWIN